MDQDSSHQEPAPSVPSGPRPDMRRDPVDPWRSTPPASQGSNPDIDIVTNSAELGSRSSWLYLCSLKPKENRIMLLSLPSCVMRVVQTPFPLPVLRSTIGSRRSKTKLSRRSGLSKGKVKLSLFSLVDDRATVQLG